MRDPSQSAATHFPSGDVARRNVTARPRPRVGRQRGFTLIEIAIAMALLAIGIGGVVGMQTVAATSARKARETAIASYIAERWVERLQAESVNWLDPVDDPSQFTFSAILTNLDLAGPDSWAIPADQALTPFGPGFDPNGNYVPAGGNVHFCTHVRWTDLYDDTITKTALRRFEVQVVWFKTEIGARADIDYANARAAGICSNSVVAAINASVLAANGQALRYLNFVNSVTILRRQAERP